MGSDRRKTEKETFTPVPTGANSNYRLSQPNFSSHTGIIHRVMASGRPKTQLSTLTTELFISHEKNSSRRGFRPPQNRKRDFHTGSSHLYRGKIRSRERSSCRKIEKDTLAPVPFTRADEKSVLESIPFGGKSKMTLLHVFHPSAH